MKLFLTKEEVKNLSLPNPTSKVGLYFQKFYRTGFFSFLAIILIHLLAWQVSVPIVGNLLLPFCALFGLLFYFAQSRTTLMYWLCFLEEPWGANDPKQGLFMVFLMLIMSLLLFGQFLFYIFFLK